MCYHVSQRQIDLSAIENDFDAVPNFTKDHVPMHYQLNGFEHGKVMVITQEESELIQLATWGIATPNYNQNIKDYWKSM
ncbi:hypothetical protein ABN763_16120 [Spongiivirga sp. MCCC 1A20706]|uniref:hypothetical protein n=1 Tax=Spongiivirga sp. MCCC 1A20706 TaxID=3160963 RepID=UPI003977C79F